jgi:hypothetical protein
MKDGAWSTIHNGVLEDVVGLDQPLKHISDNEEEVWGEQVLCRRPRKQVIHFPGTPLRSTMERDDKKSKSIQSHQRGGNPLATITVRRLCQLTESNALAKSSLRTTQGTRRQKQVCTSSVA